MISIDADRDAPARALTDRPAPVAERRAAPRYLRAAVPEIAAMRVFPGEAATLVNVSASGLLMEGTRRFAPGAAVTLLFDGTIAVRSITGRVVRCQVSAITPSGTLQYQTAVAFDERLPLTADTAQGAAAPATSRS